MEHIYGMIGFYKNKNVLLNDLKIFAFRALSVLYIFGHLEGAVLDIF